MFDHPIMFVVFMTAAVFGTAAIFKWGADALGLYGAKAVLPN